MKNQIRTILKEQGREYRMQKFVESVRKLYVGKDLTINDDNDVHFHFTIVDITETEFGMLISVLIHKDSHVRRPYLGIYPQRGEDPNQVFTINQYLKGFRPELVGKRLDGFDTLFDDLLRLKNREIRQLGERFFNIRNTIRIAWDAEVEKQ